MTEGPALDFALHNFCKAPVRPYTIMYVNYIINKKSREDKDIPFLQKADFTRICIRNKLSKNAFLCY